ncbi:MAG: hypothetical protein ACREJ5_05495 [Geminicoccaceae bacterium]
MNIIGARPPVKAAKLRGAARADGPARLDRHVAGFMDRIALSWAAEPPMQAPALGFDPTACFLQFGIEPGSRCFWRAGQTMRGDAMISKIRAW